MFCGSSCAQTTSSSRGYVPSSLRDGLDRERVELLEPGDRDACARLAEPRARRCRSRPCRSRARAARTRLVIGAGSSITGWNRPPASSSSVEDACFSRSSPFGVITTSGRAAASSACRRSRWKYCAAVVQFATRMFSCARELEEPLEPRARVLGPVALVAVRQEQGQTRRLPPLRAAGDDELVDDDLRPVDEVAELRLPEDERVRRGDRVAVLEAESRVLGERRVVDLERGVRAARDAGSARTVSPVCGVVEDEVPVRERAALGVLAGEPDRDPLLEQRRERERLRLPPVDPALDERLATPLELRASFGLTVNPSGTRRSCSLSAREPLGGDGGDDRLAACRRWERLVGCACGRLARSTR